MATLTVTNEQLRLIQTALDFYSRVGIGQMEEIARHPTFEKTLYNSLTPNKPIEIGDQTNVGVVIEIGDGYVKTKGIWNGKEEERVFNDVSIVRHSIDYSAYHSMVDAACKLFTEGRNILIGKNMQSNASYGIFSDNVDDSCRVAFDIIQVIRHEFWKADPTRSSITVDSSIHTTTSQAKDIKCSID